MADLSPNAELVYVDGELSIFDPGYNEGLEKMELENRDAGAASSNTACTTQEFIGTGNDFNSADIELANAVNEVITG